MAGEHDLPVGGDDIGGDQVVDREAEAAHQMTDPAPERQSADTGVADDSAGGRQPERLALAVEVGVQATTLNVNGRQRRIDTRPGHGRQIDDDAVIAHGVSRHGVPTAADRDQQVVGSGVAHRSGDVGGARAARDEARTTIDGAVPDASCLVIAIVGGGDDGAVESVDHDIVRENGHAASIGVGPRRG